MESIDTLILAGWIIPVVPRQRLLTDAAVAVRAGRIVAVCSRDEAQRRFRAAETVDLPDHALIPGLVNAHTHAAMALMRGIADDLPLMEWLSEHIWPREMRWVDEDFVAAGTRLAVAEMLRGGTTCFSDMYFFPDVTARVVRETGMRAAVGLIFVDFPTPWARSPEEYVAKNRDLYRTCPPDDHIAWLLAPHAPYSVSDELFREVGTMADEYDLKVHVHLHETGIEIEESLDRFGARPLARMGRLGLLNKRLVGAHMIHLEDSEIEQVAAAGCGVVHCPESNLKLASGFCPAARLDEAGIPLALGTDGAASNNDLDMFGEMRTAALLAKGVAENPEALPAPRALEMATIEGARVLGMEDRIGSLEPGKWADMAAVDLAQPETRPLFDPVSQIVYSACRQQVTDVWVGGERLLAKRRLTKLDWSALRAEVADWQTRLIQPLET
ncbi:MAG: TRZ/ATZ family hydrolase [Methylothermaceae bacterium]|nr:TRZ/ATZ family hydrolase [Methylothermaceae bacterium]